MSARYGTSAATRVGIAFQVLLAVALALAAAAALTWLSGRPGLRARFDLTAARRNTLDPQLAELIRRLPAPVKVEVFFRPLKGPEAEVFGEAFAEAQQRFHELLFIAENQVPGKLDVVRHDLTKLAQTQARMRELELEEVQTVVVHSGAQRVVLRLWGGDLARFSDPRGGSKSHVSSFRGGEALAAALLRVAQQERPKVRFATGHGERNLYGGEPQELGNLQTRLTADGFDASWWNPIEEPQVPADTAVLALVDPRQLYPESQMEAIRAYVARGGRLLVAPSSTPAAYDGRGSTAELLRGFGIQPRSGYVALPEVGPMGQLLDGKRECAILTVTPEGMDNRHPVTEPLWRMGLSYRIPGSRAFHIDPQSAPKNAIMTTILRTTRDGWLDLPNAAGLHDWRYDRKLEEGERTFSLAVAATFPPADGPRQREEGGQVERVSGRVLALGSPELLGNSQLASSLPLVLNAFNWLAERDWRLTVRPRTEERRVLDVESSGRPMFTITMVGAVGLPGVFALLGILLAFRRRR